MRADSLGVEERGELRAYRQEVLAGEIDADELEADLANDILRERIAHLKVLQTDIRSVLDVAALSLLVFPRLAEHRTRIVGIGIRLSMTALHRPRVFITEIVFVLLKPLRPPNVVGDTPK